MSEWPYYALVVSLIGNVALVARYTSAPSQLVALGRALFARQVAFEGDRLDPARSVDALAALQPRGKVFSDLQKRVATPLRVDSAGAYAEKKGLSPEVRAYLTRLAPADSQGAIGSVADLSGFDTAMERDRRI